MLLLNTRLSLSHNVRTKEIEDSLISYMLLHCLHGTAYVAYVARSFINILGRTTYVRGWTLIESRQARKSVAQRRIIPRTLLELGQARKRIRDIPSGEQGNWDINRVYDIIRNKGHMHERACILINKNTGQNEYSPMTIGYDGLSMKWRFNKTIITAMRFNCIRWDLALSKAFDVIKVLVTRLIARKTATFNFWSNTMTYIYRVLMFTLITYLFWD